MKVTKRNKKLLLNKFKQLSGFEIIFVKHINKNYILIYINVEGSDVSHNLLLNKKSIG